MSSLLREKVVPVGWLLLTPFVLVAVILWAPTAKADPADQAAAMICSSLDRNPSVANVEAIVFDLVSIGVEPYTAGAAIGQAVKEYCPWHAPVIRAYIAKWSPNNAGSLV